MSKAAECRTRPEALILPVDEMHVLDTGKLGRCADQHMRIDTAHAKRGRSCGAKAYHITAS